MPTYFVYISGENIELAQAEVEVLLDHFLSEKRITWLGRLARITMTESPVDFLLERAALVQYAGTILCEGDSIEDVIQMVSADRFTSFINEEDKFAVKTLSLVREQHIDMRLQIEKDLGAYIKSETGAGVSLEYPSVQILVVILSERVLICRSHKSKLRALLRSRKPGKKSFFHPSMMNSTLARVMCNLARVEKNDVVLDPFCGGGGILCEALYLQSYVVGIDLNWKLLMGAKKNLGEISENYTLIQGDAQSIPISSLDRIVTDPPYGRASSTRGNIAINLIKSLFENLDSFFQSKGPFMCLSYDNEMGVSQVIQDAGFSTARQITMRVHSGLTRDVVVVEI